MPKKFSFINANTKNTIPHHWYIDPEIYEHEKNNIFNHAPLYVGHSSRVPRVGDYLPLDLFNKSKLLVHGPDGLRLLSNICRHRQALLTEKPGHSRDLLCPLHAWRYNLNGKLCATPFADKCPDLALENYNLSEWQGLLFTGEVASLANDLENCQVASNCQFSNFKFHRQQITEYNFNWKIFIEVYLEDYHVVPFHPGLGQFVDCDTVKWEFHPRYSIQSLGIKELLRRPGSKAYQRWHEVLLRFCQGQLPKYGAIWMLYYPNIMIEYYPYALSVSIVIPTGLNTCKNIVEFYYPPEIFDFGEEFMEAQQEAYNETGLEDEEICRREFLGKQLLAIEKKEEYGPYLENFEEGIPHFFNYLKEHLI